MRRLNQTSSMNEMKPIPRQRPKSPPMLEKKSTLKLYDKFLFFLLVNERGKLKMSPTWSKTILTNNIIFVSMMLIT